MNTRIASILACFQGYKDAMPENMKQIIDEYKKQRAAERQKPDLKMTTIREEYKYTSDNEVRRTD